MALDPLTFFQGETFRAVIGIAKRLPDTPPLVATTNGNVVTFSGAAGSGVTVTLVVTLVGGISVTFESPIDSGWTLDEIAGITASLVAYDGAGDESIAFGAASNGPMLTVGTPDAIASVTATVTQSPFFDLTGASAVMMVRKTYASSVLITLSTNQNQDGTPGGLTLDPTAGTITFALTAAQTASLPVSRAAAATTSSYNAAPTVAGPPTTPFAYYIFDFKITLTDGDVDIVPEQVLTVKAAITSP